MAATPKTITDDSSDLDEANLNLFVRGGKLQVKVNYFQLLFTASTNAVTVVGTVDSDGEVISADLTWDAGATTIDVTLSGFSIIPDAPQPTTNTSGPAAITASKSSTRNKCPSLRHQFA